MSAAQKVQEAEESRYLFTRGGSFILDAPDVPEAVWGAGQEVLWSAGEAMILAGAQGLGKTTLAQQLAIGRCGFPEVRDLLGLPIEPGAQRVLYLAMDRPRQAARSMRRMVGEAWRAELDERLAIWKGPPPYDLAKHPHVLRIMCRDAGADTVVVDSLKDAAVGLTDDEVGAGWNRARQHALEDGVEVLELHHPRKQLSGEKARRAVVDDVYGSTWITSGAGSVLLLSGAPGDPVVGLHHVKQPAAEVGPLTVMHDDVTGASRVWESADLVELVAARGSLTALEAACALYEADKPTPSEREKARRKLAGLVRAGLLTVLEPGDKATNIPQKWGPA